MNRDPRRAQRGACNAAIEQTLDRDAILIGDAVEVQLSVAPDCGGALLSRHYVLAVQSWPEARSGDLEEVRSALSDWIGAIDFGESQVGMVLGIDDPTSPTATPRPAPLPTAVPRPRSLKVALTQNRFLLQTALDRFATADPGVGPVRLGRHGAGHVHRRRVR